MVGKKKASCPICLSSGFLLSVHKTAVCVPADGFRGCKVWWRIMYREVSELLHHWRWCGSPWSICRAPWEQHVGPVGRTKNVVILSPLSHQVPAWILELNSSQPRFHIYPSCLVRVQMMVCWYLITQSNDHTGLVLLRVYITQRKAEAVRSFRDGCGE